MSKCQFKRFFVVVFFYINFTPIVNVYVDLNFIVCTGILATNIIDEHFNVSIGYQMF